MHRAQIHAAGRRSGGNARMEAKLVGPCRPVAVGATTRTGAAVQRTSAIRRNCRGARLPVGNSEVAHFSWFGGAASKAFAEKKPRIWPHQRPCPWSAVMSVNRRWNIIGSDGDDSADRLSVEEHALDLSPELQTIADRLAGDAANLAAQFPPRQLTELRWGLSRWKIAAAVVLITTGSGAVGWWLHGAAKVNRLEPNRAVADADVAHSGASQTAADAHSPLNLSDNPAGVQDVAYSAKAPQASKLSEFDMLRIQLGAFEQVIRRLQDELARRAKSEAETANTIASLRSEIEQLRHQLQSQPAAPQTAAAESGNHE